MDMVARDVMKILGVTKLTLHRWRNHKDKDGNPAPLIKFHQIPNSRVIIYDDDDVYTKAGGRRKANTWCVIYARVKNKKDKILLEDQVSRLREFAVKLGLPVEKIYAEYADGHSFDRMQRKALFCMMRDIFDGRIDTVLIESPDRINAFSYKMFEMLCKYYKTRIIYLLNSPYNLNYKKENLGDIADIIEKFKWAFEGKGDVGTDQSQSLLDSTLGKMPEQDILPGDFIENM